MSNLTLITHPVFKEHDTGPGHPERPERLSAIDHTISSSSVNQKISRIISTKASESIVSHVHDPKYISVAKEAISNGQRILDAGDTVVGEHSMEAALHAVGAAVNGIDILNEGGSNRVFCMARPPGHHAEKDHAMGFCIFNNAAVAARYAQKMGVAEKVLIIDWDVHHGNGTQHIFEDDNTVYYYSMHQYPFYPGSGSENETGIGDGKGFTLNRPLPSGSGNTTYIEALEDDLARIEENFKAGLVIISAGFDAHRDDPLAGMLLTEEAYWKFTEIIAQYAWRYSEGRILSILEGGYDLDALGNSVVAHLDSLIKH